MKLIEIRFRKGRGTPLTYSPYQRWEEQRFAEWTSHMVRKVNAYRLELNGLRRNIRVLREKEQHLGLLKEQVVSLTNRLSSAEGERNHQRGRVHALKLMRNKQDTSILKLVQQRADLENTIRCNRARICDE